MMNIFQVFTNFVAIEHLDVDNEAIIKSCMDLQKNYAGRKISNEGGWQSNSIDLKLLNSKLCDEINSRLEELKYYFELKDSLKLKVTDAWVNINKSNDFNTPHDHGGGIFSGVYYAKAEENSGNLEFMTPIGAHTFSINPTYVKTPNPFNSNIQMVTPKTGMLVVFPSWLIHYTRSNKSEQDRVSVAFNSYV